ncbi:hypothetical protein GCM10011490_09120 [Pseudoclavibacter endophyticus]|uniref:Septum formation initiator family protein n=1 Tax=Pseudoclavibacter endophyticus TaxID=1778590 RepID=A0A6H9WNG4_9MICO|nr:septum formation initiator family protein [Pseudoclavibacter endophyticus]KAB1649628.1 septum formation initiator family protein [Pseudoclavibacter endophyticus]GGA61114.1 hypothetical protein GCM10011490_09120 [Pseudoclavibacter endophyticus]
MVKPESRTRRIVRPSGGTVIMLVTVLLGVTVLAPTLQQFISQRQRIADLQHHLATVETEIIELQTEQARWSDPAYVQAQARGRLLFVMPGETSYLVTDSDAPPPVQEPTPAQADMYETDTDWLEALGQSFVTSGFANAPGPAGAETPEGTP